MEFEEALVVEFNKIPLITGKVYPVFTGEGVDPPFLVYVSSEGTQERTLTEFTGMKTIECEIHAVGNTYEEMKTLIKAVINTIITFRQRKIGDDSGPFLYTVRYEQPEEMFEGDTWIYRASFDMTVRI
jgi:hypothetical protein